MHAVGDRTACDPEWCIPLCRRTALADAVYGKTESIPSHEMHVRVPQRVRRDCHVDLQGVELIVAIRRNEGCVGHIRADIQYVSLEEHLDLRKSRVDRCRGTDGNKASTPVGTNRRVGALYCVVPELKADRRDMVPDVFRHVAVDCGRGITGRVRYRKIIPVRREDRRVDIDVVPHKNTACAPLAIISPFVHKPGFHPNRIGEFQPVTVPYTECGLDCISRRGVCVIPETVQ